MAYTSMQVFVSDGTLQSVSFGISFLSVEHLHYYVNETEITPTSGELGVFVDGVDEYGVTLTAPVPAGAIFKVLRKTPRDKVPHVFATGAALFTALTTDANNEYLLYIVQETFEQTAQGPFEGVSIPLDGTEIVTVVQGGVTRSCSVTDLLSSLENPDTGLLAGLATWDAAAYINSLPD